MKNICKSLMAFSAILFIAVSCYKDPKQPPMPELLVDLQELDVDYSGKTTEMKIKSNRSLEISSPVSWLAFDPSEIEVVPGEFQEFTVSVTALPNEGEERNADISVKIPTENKSVKVHQKGNPDAVPTTVYKNDFDREVANEEKGRGWPYIDAFTGWCNENGSGVATLEYYGKSTSVRSNSSSNGTHAIFKGSGKNNLFFGREGFLVIGKLALHPKHRGMELSFCASKYQHDAPDNTIKPEEFPVMVSKDGKNWVTVTYAFPDNIFPNGSWDKATARFTLPEQTEALWIRFAPTVASQYRLDDVILKSAEGGEVLDWSKSQEIAISGSPLDRTKE